MVVICSEILLDANCFIVYLMFIIMAILWCYRLVTLYPSTWWEARFWFSTTWEGWARHPKRPAWPTIATSGPACNYREDAQRVSPCEFIGLIPSEILFLTKGSFSEHMEHVFLIQTRQQDLTIMRRGHQVLVRTTSKATRPQSNANKIMVFQTNLCLEDSGVPLMWVPFNQWTPPNTGHILLYTGLLL